MISLENAQMILTEVAYADMNKRNPESIKISDAYGRILCEDIRSNYYVPPFKTSNKHGYAVLASDGEGLRKVLEGENRVS